MKALEKWWKPYDTHMFECDDGNLDSSSIDTATKLGWMAALNWVLSKSSIDPLWKLNNHKSKKEPYRIIFNKEINDIKKELKEN